MANFRVSWAFQCGPYGWTEQHYAIGVAAPTLATLTPLINARRYMLAEAATIVQVTYVDLDDPRKAYVVGVNQAGDVNAGSDAEVDLPSAAIQLRITGQNGTYRHLWLRGIPTDWINYVGAIQQLLGPNDALLDNWLDAAIDQGYSIRYIDQDLSAWKDIMAISKLTTDRISMTVPGQTWSPEEYIQVRRVDTCVYPQFKGNLRIVENNSGVITTTKFAREGQVFPVVDDDMQARLLVYDYDTYLSIIKQKGRNRDTGRPIGQPRGRQSSRSCAR